MCVRKLGMAIEGDVFRMRIADVPRRNIGHADDKSRDDGAIDVGPVRSGVI